MRTLKLDIQARRLLAAENYVGTEAMSWDDLERHEVRWIVEDLIAEGSLAYLVARANMGKTFTFIDKGKAGVERDRWSASPEGFERLTIHFFHLGEVMRTVLMVMPLRSADPDLLVQVLAVVLNPLAPKP